MQEVIKSVARKYFGVEPDEIECLAGDASTRSYYRVFKSKQKIIICHDPVLSKTFSLPRTVKMALLLRKNNVKVPTLLKHDLEIGISIQEDVGDLTLEEYVKSNNENELEIYTRSVNLMCEIHSVVHEQGYECFTEAFDLKKLMFEVDHTIRYFLNGYKKTSNNQDKIRVEFEKLCKYLEGLPRVLVHRDFHSRNIMIHDDELRLIDFQDARMGIPQYDLVSLLDDCYHRVSEKNHERLLSYYMEQNGVEDKKKFIEDYELMGMQRIFKAIGSFAYMYVEKKNERYLQYIKPAYERLLYFASKNSKVECLSKLLREYEN